MPRETVVQSSFTGGEWSDRLKGRADLQKYHTACTEMENFLPLRYGPAMRRSGTRFVAEVADSAKTHRLIGFEFSTVQTYILEFGDQTLRFYRDEGQLESAGSPYQIASPHTSAQLAAIRYTQSADILYLAHPDVRPKELQRLGDTNWQFVDFDFQDGPYQPVNTDTDHQLTPSGTSGTITVTATENTFAQADADSGRHIRLRIPNRLIQDMESAGGGDQTTLTIGSHSFLAGDDITVTGTKDYDGTHEILDTSSSKVRIDVNFTYDQSDARNERQDVTVDATGGTYKLTFDGQATNDIAFDASAATVQSELEGLSTIGSGNVSVSGGPGDSGGNNPYEVTFQSDLAQQNVTTMGTQDVSLSGGASTVTVTEEFRGNDGETARVSGGGIGDRNVWGWGKITGFTSATEVTVGLETDLNGAAPTSEWRLGAWGKADTSHPHRSAGWPRAVSFHDERLWFAGTDEQPQTIWGSFKADFDNFKPTDLDEVTTDEHAATYTISDDQVNTIEHLISHGKDLIVLTNGGEFVVNSGRSTEPLSPTTVTAERQTSHGTAVASRPVRAGDRILFVQRSRKIVRDLVFDFQRDRFVSPEVSILAEHITDAGVTETAHTHDPNSIVWFVRDDGTLVSVTTERDEDVMAWARHSIGGSGSVDSVASIRQGQADQLWLIVKRTINGSTVRYVEFIEDEFDFNTDNVDVFFVDSGLIYDGSATTTITGLDHLEGETVQVVGDGAVLAEKTVSSGQITLETSVEKAQVGLKYESRLSPMPIQPQNARFEPRGKLRSSYKAQVQQWRSAGGKIEDRTGQTILLSRTPLMDMDGPTTLTSETKDLSLVTGSVRDLEITLIQDQPYPFTVLSLIFEIDLGGV